MAKPLFVSTSSGSLYDYIYRFTIRVSFNKGKRKGVEVVGRIKTASAKCSEITIKGKRISFKPKDAKPIHRSDGYRYSFCCV